MVSNETQRVVVVGGGISAARTCAALRRQGFAGEITLVGAEVHLPYDRPPLSKDVLAGRRHSTELPFDVVKLDVTARTGTVAVGLDLTNRVVRTSSGDQPFDAVVIATGSAPVTLPGTGEQRVLRTIDDALALRERLVPGARIVVIGASWIGAEVTSAARDRGCHVTCVEAGPAPLAQALGAEIGAALTPWWDGVDLRTSTLVDEVAPEGVRLQDGECLEADAVVVGIGVRPETAWLAGSGLALDRGVVVDACLRTSAPGVVAVGDVANRWSPRLGRYLRLDHWDDAGTAPAVAAASVLAHLSGSAESPAPHDPVPYFWSDQFGHKLQYVGAHDSADHLTVEAGQPGPHEPPGPGLLATWRDPDGTLTAWLGVDRMRELVAARRSVGTVPEPVPT